MGVKRNTAYNLGGAFAPALLMLVSVPLYLGIIGDERYGLLAIVWLLTGYFGFFDFGLGQATAYKVARLPADEGPEASRILWTAMVLNLGFGLIGAAIIYIFAPLLFSSVFNTPDELLNELEPTYLWIALAIPITTLEGVFTGTLMGKGNFLALNMRAVLGALLVQVAPLAAVMLLSPTLEVAVPATVIARALSLGFFAFLAFRTMNATIMPRFGNSSLFREMLGYGGWVTLGKSVLQLVGNLDRFVIAAVLTPFAVTLYSIPFQLIARGGQIPRALASAMFPDFAKRNEEEARPLAIQAIRANLAAMTLICFLLIVFFRPFLSIWINDDFAAKAGLAASIITLSLWVNAVAIVAIMLLEAQGRPKATFFVSAIQALPYAALVIAGAVFGGIVGVALARNARSILDAALLCAFAGLLKMALPLALLPGLTLVAAVIWNAAVESVIMWIGNLVLFVSCAVLAYRLFPEGFDILKAVFQRHASNPARRGEF